MTTLLSIVRTKFYYIEKSNGFVWNDKIPFLYFIEYFWGLKEFFCFPKKIQCQPFLQEYIKIVLDFFCQNPKTFGFERTISLEVEIPMIIVFFWRNVESIFVRKPFELYLTNRILLLEALFILLDRKNFWSKVCFAIISYFFVFLYGNEVVS